MKKICFLNPQFSRVDSCLVMFIGICLVMFIGIAFWYILWYVWSSKQ